MWKLGATLVGFVVLAVATADAGAADKKKSPKVKMETFVFKGSLVDMKNQPLRKKFKTASFCYNLFYDGQSNKEAPSQGDCETVKLDDEGRFKLAIEVPWERKSLMQVKYTLSIPGRDEQFKVTAFGQDIMFKMLPPDAGAPSTDPKVASRSDSGRSDPPTDSGRSGGKRSAGSTDVR